MLRRFLFYCIALLLVCEGVEAQNAVPYGGVTTTRGVLVADVTDTTATDVIAAQPGYRFGLIAATIYNSHATVATRVDILDGSTVLWSVWVAAAGGEIVLDWPLGAPLLGTAGNALKIQCGTTGAAVRASFNAVRY